ncbi:META domain-containing protein [Flagellimonas sp. S3867]|uniref:META domain-containing protein n=1 Tax=Flagellimonas sp. S3867 TaxID=2768063 RepID=UPI00168355D7|nr:META domain-containing protein [Flagellimonas sp. S3867]
MNFRFLTLSISFIVFALNFACSTDATSATNQKVLGTWLVLAIHNSSPSGPTLGPNTGEIISITFKNDGSFGGTTSVNTFGGQFSTTSNSLLIEELEITEVADTNFGRAFYESFDESRNSDTAFSEFKSVFTENNILNLEYQGFKFLTLQKQ